MIQAVNGQPSGAPSLSLNQFASRFVSEFAEYLKSASTAGPATQAAAKPVEILPDADNAPLAASHTASPAASSTTPSATSSTGSSTTSTDLGDPDIQGWLNTFYSEGPQTAGGSGDPAAAAISYQAAAGAGSNYTSDTIYGPDQVYAQAVANQCGNSFATMTGQDPVNFTSQLPGIPDQQAQDTWDNMLAYENAVRLESGQPIDTSAYWSDPGPRTINGHTYTSQQLGYAGPCQSSGPEPIWISQADQVPGTDTFNVPGYQGTVSGIQPGRYYTLAQLQQAGLPSGQPDTQYYPGSWTQPS